MGVAARNGARVNLVDTDSPPSNQTQPSSNQTPQGENSKSQTKRPNTLVTALEAMQSNLASLKVAFDRVSDPVERNSTRPYASGNQSQFRRLQCNLCRKAGVDNCNHCFKYSSTDHSARCRRASGNGERLCQGNSRSRIRPTMSKQYSNCKSVNRNTADNIRHFARPLSSLEEPKRREDRERQVSL